VRAAVTTSVVHVLPGQAHLAHIESPDESGRLVTDIIANPATVRRTLWGSRSSGFRQQTCPCLELTNAATLMR